MKTVQEQKASLRARFRQVRKDLDAADYRSRSEAICQRAMAESSLQEASTVLAYWPREERREVDTRPLLEWLSEHGARLALPVVDTFTGRDDRNGTPSMHAVLFEGPQQLQPNRWGVYEPAGSETVPVADLDVVIVPAFGAGRNGHRIGHGKGYYDHFLARCPATTIGLIYDVCLVPVVPAEPHDVPLDILITENERLIVTMTST